MVVENTKRMCRKLRSLQNKSKTGLSRLEVPEDINERNYKQCKEWISITTPKDIEEKLGDRNQYHFGQAKGSFPTVPPFSEWVDWGASTHVAELILEGNFNETQINGLTQEMISHMKKKTTLDKIPATITMEEWV